MKASIGALFALLILLSAAWPADAQSERVLRDGDSHIVLTREPCTNRKVVKQVIDAGLPTLLKVLRAARARFGDKTFEACWADRSDLGAVALLYEDGDQGLIPVDRFKIEDRVDNMK